MSTNTNTKMAVVKSAKLPARKSQVPDLRPFNAFIAKCDDVMESYNELADALRNPDPGEHVAGHIENDRDDYYKQNIAECREGLALFDRQDRYDGDDLAEDFVADRLGAMISAIPNANPHAPEGYSRMLVANILAFEGLDALVLESSCREIEQTAKFTPAIPELLAALKKHAALWTQRRMAINGLEGRCIHVIAALLEAETKAREREISRQRDIVARRQQEVIDAGKREAKASADLREAKNKFDALAREDAELKAEQLESAKA
jgi:hypothetical protein